jgi:hypothetical protein
MWFFVQEYVAELPFLSPVKIIFQKFSFFYRYCRRLGWALYFVRTLYFVRPLYFLEVSTFHALFLSYLILFQGRCRNPDALLYKSSDTVPYLKTAVSGKYKICNESTLHHILRALAAVIHYYHSISYRKGLLKSSIADPDSYMFGPPGSGSRPASTRYGPGSGSFYHQAKIARKTLIPKVL